MICLSSAGVHTRLKLEFFSKKRIYFFFLSFFFSFIWFFSLFFFQFSTKKSFFFLKEKISAWNFCFPSLKKKKWKFLTSFFLEKKNSNLLFFSLNRLYENFQKNKAKKTEDEKNWNEILKEKEKSLSSFSFSFKKNEFFFGDKKKRGIRKLFLKSFQIAAQRKKNSFAFFAFYFRFHLDFFFLSPLFKTLLCSLFIKGK